MGKNILILGGGYGGMRIIQRLLAANLPNDVTLTLVDRIPHHCLKTEYYALAAGTQPDTALRVAFPEDPRLTIVYDRVTKIDVEQKLVELEAEQPLTYDYLIIGLGCEDRYHGIPGADRYTLSIQSMNRTRKTSQVLNALGAGATVAIVGGGLSGVELAAELRESRSDLHIQLFDRGERILSAFPEKLSNYVSKWFAQHQVELISGANITRVEANCLYNHDQAHKVDVVVWTAGIQANKVAQQIPGEKDSMGRLVLTEEHTLLNFPDVFVVGDCASLPHAPSAQLAEAQGDQIALVIQAYLNNTPVPPLGTFKLKGTLGSLGKKTGFGVMGSTSLTGVVPRMIKSGILWMYKYHSG